MKLIHAIFCLDCEELFTHSETRPRKAGIGRKAGSYPICPACASTATYPLRNWLNRPCANDLEKEASND